MQKQGSRMLQVCGILMIIGAAFGIIISLLGFVGLGVLSSTDLLGEDLYAATATIAVVAIVVQAIVSVVQLVAGILGVKNWSSPEKAQSCVVLGIVILVMCVASLIFSFAAGSVDGTNIVSQIVSFILPILYLVGALQLKKMA